MPLRAPQAALSLKARALRWLAQREHSRQELRLKLVRAVRRDAEASADASASFGKAAPDAAAIEALLDTLESAGHLSETRFVESRIRTRAARFGNRRIEAEIRQHGLDAGIAVIEDLGGSECQRAYRVWARKFGPVVSTDRDERARQARFLAARGFGADTVRDIVQGKAAEPDD
jgi:regulatory protein